MPLTPPSSTKKFNLASAPGGGAPNRALRKKRKWWGQQVASKSQLNVATTPLRQARAFAEDMMVQAGLDLDEVLPDFDRNYKMLQRKMSSALNIPRIQMPVIEPKTDLAAFAKRLQSGHIDIFPPYARGRIGGDADLFPWYPEMRGGKRGKEWVTLGFVDGDVSDDVVKARLVMTACRDLLPLQGEIWLSNCIGNIISFGPAEPGGFLLTNAVVIISKEGYILDGHHRFGQAMLASPKLKMKTLKVPLDIETLLKVGRSYGSAIGNAPKESLAVRGHSAAVARIFEHRLEAARQVVAECGEGSYYHEFEEAAGAGAAGAGYRAARKRRPAAKPQQKKAAPAKAPKTYPAYKPKKRHEKKVMGVSVPTSKRGLKRQLGRFFGASSGK